MITITLIIILISIEIYSIYLNKKVLAKLKENEYPEYDTDTNEFETFADNYSTLGEEMQTIFQSGSVEYSNGKYVEQEIDDDTGVEVITDEYEYRHKPT